MPLWGTPLAEVTAAAVRAAGMTIVHHDPGEGERLVVGQGTALGRHALAAAAVAGAAAGRDARIVLGGRVGELLAEVLRGRPSGLAYLTGADPVADRSLEARIAAADELELDPAEQSLDVWLPGADPFAVSDRLILPVRHWVDLLWANLLGLGPALWGSLVGRSVATSALRLGWGALRALSLRPEHIAARLSRRGAGAWVHPRAVVEASLLGPGVRVGAGAVVRGCVLGEGSVVEDLACCEGVVAGPGVVIQRQAMCKFSTLGAGARVAGAMQLAVLGPGASLKRGAYLMDQALAEGGGVRVDIGGELGPAPMGMTGVCLGARTSVGSGVWIAPGRCLPPDLVITHGATLLKPTAPEEATPGQALVVRDGRLSLP